jgi:hypothetical protein
MSKKRAFVRYTKSGEIVPGSLVITTSGGYPDKTSLWQEVKVDLCCTCKCYEIRNISESTFLAQWYSCYEDGEISTQTLDPNELLLICTTKLISSENLEVTENGLCEQSWTCPRDLR